MRTHTDNNKDAHICTYIYSPVLISTRSMSASSAFCKFLHKRAQISSPIVWCSMRASQIHMHTCIHKRVHAITYQPWTSTTSAPKYPLPLFGAVCEKMNISQIHMHTCIHKRVHAMTYQPWTSTTSRSASSSRCFRTSAPISSPLFAAVCSAVVRGGCGSAGTNLLEFVPGNSPFNREYGSYYTPFCVSWETNYPLLLYQNDKSSLLS